MGITISDFDLFDDYEYYWSFDLTGVALEHYEKLCSAFDTLAVETHVERLAGSLYGSEFAARTNVEKILTRDLESLGVGVAEHLGIKFSDEHRSILGLTIKDQDNREYKVVDEDPRQMFLFPVDNPKMRVYL